MGVRIAVLTPVVLPVVVPVCFISLRVPPPLSDLGDEELIFLQFFPLKVLSLGVRQVGLEYVSVGAGWGIYTLSRSQPVLHVWPLFGLQFWSRVWQWSGVSLGWWIAELGLSLR